MRCGRGWPCPGGCSERAERVCVEPFPELQVMWFVGCGSCGCGVESAYAGRPWSLPSAERVSATAMDYRTNLTMRQLEICIPLFRQG